MIAHLLCANSCSDCMRRFLPSRSPWVNGFIPQRAHRSENPRRADGAAALRPTNDGSGTGKCVAKLSESVTDWRAPLRVVCLQRDDRLFLDPNKPSQTGNAIPSHVQFKLQSLVFIHGALQLDHQCTPSCSHDLQFRDRCRLIALPRRVPARRNDGRLHRRKLSPEQIEISDKLPIQDLQAILSLPNSPPPTAFSPRALQSRAREEQIAKPTQAGR